MTRIGGETSRCAMYLNIAILYLLVLVSANGSSQNEVAPVAQPEDLATVSIIPAKRSFKVGEPIEVTLLLQAGRRCVYVAKGWGKAGGGIPGFFVNIETLAAREAQTGGFGADGFPTTYQDAAKLLREHFVFVGPSQIVGWKTNVL